MARRLLGARSAKRPQPDQMTVWQHLGELRDRIIYSMMAIAVCAIVGFVFFHTIVGWVIGPYHDATGDPSKGLIFTNPLEAFMTRIKVAAYTGFALASPIVFWNLWRFITPGLNPKEKRYAIPFVVSSVFLFLGGSAVAVFTFPKALDFLLSIGGEDLDPLLTANSYLNLYFLMLVAFGVAFEFPVLITFLLLARVLNTAQLRRWRRPACVTIVVVAAVITPSQDPISLFAMAVPMYILYEVSILIGRLLKR